MILHIAEQSEWNNQETDAFYQPSGFAKEGFIHCCSQAQLPGVLQRYYMNRKDLLLLTLDEGRLNARLQYDQAPNGELFPHIYGPINKTAIVSMSAVAG
jgi:uncharacterized protein (DUF952 family)